jgi:hypothetical protein
VSTLLQFVLGVLAQRGVIMKGLNRYVPFVSQELLDLYPAVSVLGDGFDCQI